MLKTKPSRRINLVVIRLATAALLAASIVGCKTPTQFVLHIDSDLEAETEIERIVVRSGPAGAFLPISVDATHEYVVEPVAVGPTSITHRTLPFSFAVLPDGPLPRTARIEATAYLAPAPGETEQRTITRTVESDFRCNQALGLVLRLDEDCAAVVCNDPSFTCDRGVCVDVYVPGIPGGGSGPEHDAGAEDAGQDDADVGDDAELDAGRDAAIDVEPDVTADTCVVNEFVREGRCWPCPPGTTNEAGDDASGGNTTCDDVSDVDACSSTFGVTCDRFDEAYIKASNTEAQDYFSDGVAISADGNTLAVGARYEDSAASGVGGDETDNSIARSGAVYIFRRRGTTWAQEAYIKASNPSMDDQFGSVLTLSADGSRLVVGVGDEDSSATGVGSRVFGSGAVYTYQRTGTTWEFEAYIKAPTAHMFEYFGSSIAISADGTILAVGADGDSSPAGVEGELISSGAVYMYRHTGVTWEFTNYIKAPNADARDRFGFSVALSADGRTLGVSAIYEASSARGVDGDQDDNSAEYSGAVYVYQRTGGGWEFDAYIKASNTDADDRFGDALTLSADGTTLAVGTWLEDSAATRVGGDESDNSESFAGAVYVFRRQSGRWAQDAYIKASDTDTNHVFGEKVKLSSDGSVLAATSSGAVHVYRRTDRWTHFTLMTGDDGFGRTLGLSADGTTLAVGAYRDPSAATGVDGDRFDDSAPYSGAVYIRRIAP